MDMNNCGASEKHPESKNEIAELQKLIKDLPKKEAKASEELQSFKLAKERSVNSFFAVMRPRLRRQNEGLYVDRFSLDKDLILFKKIFNFFRLIVREVIFNFFDSSTVRTLNILT